MDMKPIKRQLLGEKTSLKYFCSMNRPGLYIFVILLCLTACTKKETETALQYVPTDSASVNTDKGAHVADEATAQAVLDTARLAFSAGGFEKARTLVKSVRTRYPHALNAREDAILLLDSIEIQEAAAKVARLDATGQTETDEATAIERAKAADKVEYFREKLARDIAMRKKH